jgi:hypothetical protein
MWRGRSWPKCMGRLEDVTMTKGQMVTCGKMMEVGMEKAVA